MCAAKNPYPYPTPTPSQVCGQEPTRTLTLPLPLPLPLTRCAAKNEHAMLSIEEPSVHKYVVEFSTPLACELNCAFAREPNEDTVPGGVTDAPNTVGAVGVQSLVGAAAPKPEVEVEGA